ncbi:hypothetical protein FGIG_05468 [Fasciola gigantica]|uniref:Uncharacterized protein n=1 Tax=Fasciola gigantica TaxID=46835 RepID=A0A504YEI8_FASGI|nr:hypothetical protein FGIG_05468 [Fasciola gigantica]
MELKQQSEDCGSVQSEWFHPSDQQHQAYSWGLNTPLQFIDSMLQSLHDSSLCLISGVILGHTYDTVLYIMSTSGTTYSYDVGSDAQLISVFVTTLNSIINPMIIALSVPSVRRLNLHLGYSNGDPLKAISALLTTMNTMINPEI